MAQEKLVQRFDIVDGPSKWELMLALFDNTYEPGTYHRAEDQYRQTDRKIVFKINYLDKQLCGEAFISKVGRRPISLEVKGDSWDIEGNCYLPLDPKGFITYPPFTAFYNTQTRKGWIEFEP